jgi:3-dehydroquinate synthase
MKRLCEILPLGREPYPVLVSRDAPGAVLSVWQPSWHAAVVVGDSTTAPRFGAPIATALRTHGIETLELSFPAGEANKTREAKARLEDAMLEAHVPRGAVLVGVGGGVTLDLAGFVAATYLRGIPHVAVATTLLAHVDAAIGGKTAVDTPYGKNLIGAFHHPRAVVLDMAALASLPSSELRYGLAECVKHAALRDPNLFALLEESPNPGERELHDLVARAVAVKATIIGRDPEERGERAILNFGHTVAHAIEAATGHRTPHGAAVSMGLVVESRLAARAAWFPSADAARIASLLERIGLPTSPGCSFDAAARYFAGDKKNVGGHILCSLPDRLGTTTPHQGRWTRAVTLEQLREAWA